MARKPPATSIDDFLRNNLQASVREEVGRRGLEQTAMPECFATSLNPAMKLRPYQREAFQYFINYWEAYRPGRVAQPHVLFHMATGSGKTLVMAGLVLWLYEQGYRNFLFFVNSDNVIEKARDNFFNAGSAKYLFGRTITIGGRRVEVRPVDNFQGTGNGGDGCINLCLTTIQGLHIAVNAPSEGGVTIDDFRDKRIVLIADEAHHINTATKRGEVSLSQRSFDFGDDTTWAGSSDWETTVMAIMRANAANVLLEFTATEDFANPAIAEKYRDKVLFDYSLKKFREDGYSKNIKTMQSDLPPVERAIQAVVMSQFRRKLAGSVRQDIKPVVLFKSKTIAANKAFYDEFARTIRALEAADLQRIKEYAKEDMLVAFSYFDEQGISLENLVLELRDDFKEDNLLLVDGNNITAEKQLLLNSLEARDNEYRAVFAVDMLNEGWDVLNLYDIVRLYDTRDARQGVVGRTTNQEAQLIGRGARYMPFSDKPERAADVEYCSQRKFDNDLGNRLCYLETLHYHSASNPRYIQELSTALANSGIMASNRREITERLKESFIHSRLYTNGYVFTNKPTKKPAGTDGADIGEEIREMLFTVRLKTGEMLSNEVFAGAGTPAVVLAVKQHTYTLGELGAHVVRAAINRLESFRFDRLTEVYPKLRSIKEFIESDKYLACVRVAVYGGEDTVGNLSQRQKLEVATEVLRQMEPILAKKGVAATGTKLFEPKLVKDVFKAERRYCVATGGSDKEEGIAMSETTNSLLHIDLANADWYAYNDNYGTSEEKYLIRYVEEIVPRLREKYSEIYLIRNYKDLKIYAFDDGRATEPDFVMFLRHVGDGEQYDNLQIFIEPKGEQLRATDSWKAVFQTSIHENAEIHFCTPSDQFQVWGLPFFTQSRRREFEQALQAANLL